MLHLRRLFSQESICRGKGEVTGAINKVDCPACLKKLGADKPRKDTEFWRALAKTIRPSAKNLEPGRW